MGVGKYDKTGRPIDLATWCRLSEDLEYRRIGSTDLPDGSWVSTVWLGLDHSFSGVGPPLIFETMVFGPARDEKGRREQSLDMARWSTLDEALHGHEQMVVRWTAKAEGAAVGKRDDGSVPGVAP